MPNSTTDPKIIIQQHGLTALVAGGCGFLGSRLCEMLLSQNLTVLAVDNLSHSSRENVKHLLPNPRFSLLEHDLNSTTLRIGEETKIDYVFHLAGVEENVGKEELSLETLLVNSLGTKHLLDIARSKKAKFLLVSTADLYTGALSSQSLNYYFGRNLRYGSILAHHEAKRYAEALTYEYLKKYNLDARICRVQDVYGPGLNLDNGGVLNTLIKEALEGSKLTIRGDGLDTLHPTYVTDVIFGLLKAVLQENTKGKIFNLINPQKITLLELAAEFNKAFAKNLDLVFTKNEDVASPGYYPLGTETLNILNWKPKVSLIDGLISTSAEYKKERPTSIPLSVATPRAEVRKSPFKWPNFLTFKSNSQKTLTPKRSKKYLNRNLLRLTIFLASLLLVLLGVLYPLASFFISVNNAQRAMSSGLKELASGNLSRAQIDTAQAALNWERASKDLNNLTWLATMLQIRSQTNNWDQTIFGLSNLALSAKFAIGALKPLQDLEANFKNPQPDSSVHLVEKFNTEEINLSQAGNKLAVAEATFLDQERVGKKTFLTPVEESFKKIIPQNKELIRTLRDLYQVLPDSLGFNGSKNYLIVDTSEATTRSTGGLLKDYLLLVVENGGVKKQTVGSIASLNTPTSPLSTGLKTSLTTEKTGFAESLWVVALGEGSAPLQNYFANRGQPLNGLSIVSESALTKIGNGKKIELKDLVAYVKAKTNQSWPQFLSILNEGLTAKEISFLSPNELLGSVLAEKNWSGEVLNETVVAGNHLKKKPAGGVQELLTDYLQVVSDSFTKDTTLEPKINYQLDVSSVGLLESTLTIDYVNKTTTDLQGYIRVLVPLGSILETKQLSAKNDIVVEQKSSKTQFGFSLNLKGGESKQVVLKYQLPVKVNNSLTTYSILVQKQLGPGASSFQGQINLPVGTQIDNKGDFSIDGPRASVSEEINKDRSFTFNFQKN